MIFGEDYEAVLWILGGAILGGAIVAALLLCLLIKGVAYVIGKGLNL